MMKSLRPALLAGLVLTALAASGCVLPWSQPTGASSVAPKFTVTVSAIPGEGGTVSGGGVFEVGSLASILATSRPGYHFSYWSGGLSGNENPAQVPIDGDKNIVGSYAPDWFQLTVDVVPAGAGTITGGGDFNPATRLGHYPFTGLATLEATAHQGFQFSGWTGDFPGGNGGAAPTTATALTEPRDYHVTAEFRTWAWHQVTVTSAQPTMGSVTGGGYFPSGNLAYVSATAMPGYHFSCWFLNGVRELPVSPGVIQVNEPNTLVAQFSPGRPYDLTIRISPPGAGTATGAGTYIEGLTATVLANPASRFRFDRWTGDLTSVGNPATLVMNNSKWVTANFAEVICDAPVSNPAGGDFSAPQYVTLSTTTVGAVIRYTTDGSTPTGTSPIYTSPVIVSRSQTLRAAAYKEGLTPSAVTQAVFTISPSVTPPGFSLFPGTYTAEQSVALASTTPGAVIRYTTDGSTPTRTAGTVYSRAITVGSSAVIRAVAFSTASTLADSRVVSRTYHVKPIVVSAWNGFNVALKPDGTVWTWGAGAEGQLGHGTFLNQSTPGQVQDLTGVVAVSAGGSFVLALKGDGTVWGWGANWYGQLGDGTTTSTALPVQVQGLSGVVAVSAGYEHGMALKNDGTVWTWGDNWSGQLGDGGTTSRVLPVEVTALRGVVAIDAGTFNSTAIREDGTVWSWGGNGNGQIGDGSSDYIKRIPARAVGLTDVAAISCGMDFTLAQKGDRTFWAWGENGWGQFGDSTNQSRSTPWQVTALTGLTDFSAGAYHSAGVKSDGTLWTWGGNWHGQLGDGTLWDNPVPDFVLGLTNMITPVAGQVHSVGVKRDGTLYAWGANNAGQLGDGTTIDRDRPVLVVW